MKRLKTLKSRKGLKDKEKEDPTSDKGLENIGDSENESYSEVQRSIQRREKINEGDKLKSESAKKKPNLNSMLL